MWPYIHAGMVGIDTGIGLSLLFNIGRLDNNDADNKVLAMSKRSVLKSTDDLSRPKIYALNQN